MFITRECDYAIRIIRALGDFTRKTVTEICEKEHVPLPYAYKILKKLEGAGLVCSKRGPSGGYSLAKDMSNITLYDIIAATNQDIFINECLTSGFQCPMNSKDQCCMIHKELFRIQRELVSLLQEKSLCEILDN